MPEAEVANAGQGQNAQARGGSNVLGTIIRMLIFWYMFSWFKGGNKGPTTPENTAVAKYSKGHLLDMYVFMSEKPNFRGFNVDELIWEEKGVGLAEKMDRTYAYTYHPSKYVQNNGSLYLHSLFVDSGRDIEDEAVQADVTIHTHALIKYMPRPKEKVGTNLLTGEHAPGGPMPEVKEDKPREIVSFFKPNATIVMIDHFQSYPKNAIPPQYAGFMVFDEDGDYYPIIIYNDFWLLRDKMILMNETVTEVTLNLRLTSLHHWWWQMQMQMEQSFMMQSSMGMTQEGESDEFKRVLLEGNPYLLAVTFVVSCLHSVFDFLAFKNDIGFWKENKSMEGLSARSVIINAFCQAVIFLYLMDSETSFVVLLSSGAGTAIEFWKVTKAMHVSFDPKKFPYIHFKDRKSYGQKDTKKFDEEAMRYLSYALYPLVIGYAVYTLIYETHKSWYSWLLSTLVGAVYTFGFILMCPQLYLNYKLKSVAHLPWRQMTYKFLNTIIDDLFAFVIKMPLLHRLSVFRDDVVFFIYIYQRWIYRVDKTRANEFGYMEEKPEEEEAEQQEEEKSEEKDKEDLGDSSTGKKAARKDASKKEVPIADVASQDEGSSKKDL